MKSNNNTNFENDRLYEIEFHTNKVITSSSEDFDKSTLIDRFEIQEELMPTVIYLDKIFSWPPFLTISKETLTGLEHNYQYWQVKRRLFFIEAIKFTSRWFKDENLSNEIVMFINQYIVFSITEASNIIELDERIEDMCKTITKLTTFSEVTGNSFYNLLQLMPLDYIDLYYTGGYSGQEAENQFNVVIELSKMYESKRYMDFTDTLIFVTTEWIDKQQNLKSEEE